MVNFVVVTIIFSYWYSAGLFTYMVAHVRGKLTWVYGQNRLVPNYIQTMCILIGKRLWRKNYWYRKLSHGYHRKRSTLYLNTCVALLGTVRVGLISWSQILNWILETNVDYLYQVVWSMHETRGPSQYGDVVLWRWQWKWQCIGYLCIRLDGLTAVLYLRWESHTWKNGLYIEAGPWVFGYITIKVYTATSEDPPRPL